MEDHLNPVESSQTADASAYAEWAASNPLALGRVKLGLTLVCVSSYGILLALLAMPPLGLLVALAPRNQGAFLIGGTFFLLSLLIFVGMILCAAVPEESGMQPWVCAAVVLQASSYAICGLAVLPVFVSLQLMPPPIATAFAIVGGSLGMVSLTCFVLFLRGMARYIGRPDIAERAKRTLATGGLAAVLMLGWSLLATMQPNQAQARGVTGLFFGGGGLLSLLAFVMYANTVTHLRKAITIQALV